MRNENCSALLSTSYEILIILLKYFLVYVYEASLRLHKSIIQKYIILIPLNSYELSYISYYFIIELHGECQFVNIKEKC